MESENKEVKPRNGNESCSSRSANDEPSSAEGKAGVASQPTSSKPTPLSFDDVVEELERMGKTGHKYTDGWDPEKLEEVCDLL